MTSIVNSVANPLGSDACDASDLILVQRSIEGDTQSLRELIERHQVFVFNIAMKMFGHRENAEDLTQEVLIKIITSLRSFRGESVFRTWLYRIATNHFLKTKRRGMELTVVDFESHFDAVDLVPDDDLAEKTTEINGKTIEELRLRCTAGMLMCLDREQRLIFILGALFEVSHQLGAEILEITPGNFRVRLHRARTELYNWMNQRCGLVNKANPCRCAKKTHRYVRDGLVDPQYLIFNTEFVIRIKDVTIRRAQAAMEAVDDLHEKVFLDHPLHLSKVRVMDELLGNEAIRSLFDIRSV
jgi:RNA polymerase sigma factor (sigma-70 family)